MTSLFVQNYLKSGKSLTDLKLEHGVKSFVQNSKISLTYDQIEARDSDPLSQQCRGLILKETSYEAVAVPMFRFFNKEQIGVAASVDLTTAVFEEKLDGTLILIYYDQAVDKWFCATRSRPEADVNVDDGNYTFTDLVNMTIKNNLGFENINEWMNSCVNLPKTKTFCFEFCSPLNRIVCNYQDFSLTLLSVRDNVTFQEEDPVLYTPTLGIPTIKTYSFSSLSDLIEVVNRWNPKEHEGIVVKDANFNRVKIKSPAYVAYNHMRDSLSTSLRGCVEVILIEKDDDVISMLPDFIGNRIKRLKPIVAQVLRQAQQDFDDLSHIEDMKEFALAAQQKAWPAVLFSLKRGRTSSVLQFAKGNIKDLTKIPTSAVDTMLSLCQKIDPSIKNL